MILCNETKVLNKICVKVDIWAFSKLDKNYSLKQRGNSHILHGLFHEIIQSESGLEKIIKVQDRPGSRRATTCSILKKLGKTVQENY